MKWKKLLAIGMTAVMTAAFVSGCGSNNAKDAGGSSSAGKKIVVANGIDEIVRQQKAIGRNLNQIATLANMDRLTAVNFQPLLDEHTKVTDMIGQLLREVK